MGLAMEVIHGRATNPSTTITACTAGTGDSFAVRNFGDSGQAMLVAQWALGATAGIVRVRSPRIHDNVQGLRYRTVAANSQPLFPLGQNQKLYAQDTLVVELSGGASETDVQAYMNYYTDLPGSAARFIDTDTLKRRARNMVTVETNHTTGSTAGDYGGTLALNANFDLLKANTDYAIVGYLTDVNVCSVGYRGPDTGNLRVGGPGTTDRYVTFRWFEELYDQLGMPCIPVINSANKAGTNIDLVHTSTSTTVNLTTILAELGPTA